MTGRSSCRRSVRSMPSDPISTPTPSRRCRCERPRTVLNQDPSPSDGSSSAHRRSRSGQAGQGRLRGQAQRRVLALCARPRSASYLETTAGIPDEPLVTQCPVSLRPRAAMARSATRSARCSPPSPPTSTTRSSRLATIHESTTRPRRCARPCPRTRSWGSPRSWRRHGSGSRRAMYTRRGLAKIAPPAVNVVVSNVPGPPFPLYVVGSRVESMYPMGPLIMGMSLNITRLQLRRPPRLRLHGLPGGRARPADAGRRHRGRARRARGRGGVPQEAQGAATACQEVTGWLVSGDDQIARGQDRRRDRFEPGHRARHRDRPRRAGRHGVHHRTVHRRRRADHRHDGAAWSTRRAARASRCGPITATTTRSPPCSTGSRDRGRPASTSWSTTSTRSPTRRRGAAGSGTTRSRSGTTRSASGCAATTSPRGTRRPCSSRPARAGSS